MFEDLSRRRPNVHFISPPVDLERDSCERVEATAFLRESGVREDIPRVVIVSRLSEDMKAHGVEAVLDAAAMLPEGAAQLVIVGTGDAEARLRALGDRINAASTVRRVFFVGAMSDPRPAYAAADIVVGMGGSAARALSFGKPLIAVGERGWSETFAPATAERLFRDSFWSPAHQAGAARRVEVHLRTLLGSHEARAHLGAYGRAFAASRFGLSTMSEKLALVYEAALRRSPRPDRWLEEAIRHEIPKAVAWAGRRRGSIHWLKQAR
jgi:glycosyltransferase involved in cell wall biosynthesis